MPDPRIHAALPINPEDLLDAESIRRIREAREMARGEHLKADAQIESRQIDPSTPRAAHIQTQAKMRGADIALTQIVAALGRIAPNRSIFREWMSDEIEGLCNTWELGSAQKSLLEHKYLVPPAFSAASQRDPLKSFLDSIKDLQREQELIITENRDLEYRKILQATLDGGCMGKAQKRIDAYETYSRMRAMMIANTYVEVALVFKQDALLTLPRLEHLRREIHDSIGREGKPIREGCRKECGDHSPLGSEIDSNVWGAQSRIMEFVVERLVVAQNESVMRQTAPATPTNTPPVRVEPIARSSAQETIGQRIKLFRMKCNGLTQQDLAERVGLQIRQVQRHENGDATPQDRAVFNYNRAFSELLGYQIDIREKT